MQKRFSTILFDAVQNLFLEDNCVLILFKLSNSCMHHESHQDLSSKREKVLSDLFDILNHILEGGEVVSLF